MCVCVSFLEPKKKITIYVFEGANVFHRKSGLQQCTKSSGRNDQRSEDIEKKFESVNRICA